MSSSPVRNAELNEHAVAILRRAIGARRSLFGATVESNSGLFEAMDRDSDGQVTAAEFTSSVRRLDLGLTADQTAALLQHFDTNGNGTVDRGEFVRTLGHAMEIEIAPLQVRLVRGWVAGLP